ncbi:phosphatidylserine/phosphatidylglycerophosphate/cardiolipin synthase family protein [Candidatus Peribacteria bacterium]|nr:phosphatidylserine/phosphatidylglycerophosphate/cardiolipin synthase family protein [Candidatus Peribacteria bacterium]
MLTSFSSFLSRRALRSALRGGLQYVFGKRGQRRVHGWRLFYKMRVQVMLRSPRPITGISRFPTSRLWVDQEAFPRIKKLIRRAKHTVLIQMFIWKDDVLGREMAALLVEVADRGVHVQISKEAVGDLFELHRDFLGTKDGGDGMWKRFWNHPNIRILYETNNDHAKVFIIDERIFLLTGMNIADEYHHDWHDYMVELRGRHFVEHYLTNGEFSGADSQTRLVMNSHHSKEIRPAVMDLLRSAKRSIVVEHCYLSDQAALDLLIRRSHDGISVVLILPTETDFHHYANMQSVSRILTEGDRKNLAVFLYPKMMHAKIILVDRERAFVGSANLMTSSLDEMGEVNVLLQGRHLNAVHKLRDILRQDILRSTPVSRPPRFRWLWKWLTWLQL